MRLVMLPGDGIGPEISAVVRDVLRVLDQRFELKLEIVEYDIGINSLQVSGSTLPDDVLKEAKAADGVILGPVDTAVYPPPEDGGINPSAVFRKELDLYANIRPAKTRPGINVSEKNIDLVIVRENTEGFYADRTMFAGAGEFMPTPDLALAVRKISREGSYRIGLAAAQIAASRPRKKITIVTKSNVLKLSDGLFKECCREAATHFSGLDIEEIHVDAMASLLVRQPEAFDVVVTSNMFGDILSNLANELSGGLGLGASINFGDKKAIAQASHGTAPDIQGKDQANPVALLLSTGMLINWLGERSESNVLIESANLLQHTIDKTLMGIKNRTVDLGGPLGTKAFGEFIVRQIENGLQNENDCT